MNVTCLFQVDWDVNCVSIIQKLHRQRKGREKLYNLSTISVNVHSSLLSPPKKYVKSNNVSRIRVPLTISKFKPLPLVVVKAIMGKT